MISVALREVENPVSLFSEQGLEQVPLQHCTWGKISHCAVVSHVLVAQDPVVDRTVDVTDRPAVQEKQVAAHAALGCPAQHALPERDAVRQPCLEFPLLVGEGRDRACVPIEFLDLCRRPVLTPVDPATGSLRELSDLASQG